MFFYLLEWVKETLLYIFIFNHSTGQLYIHAKYLTFVYNKTLSVIM